MISVHFQGKSYSTTVTQVYDPTTNAKETKWFQEEPQDLLERTPKKKKKDVLFIIGDWNAKVGSQEIPGVTGNLALEYKIKQGKGRHSFAKRTHWSLQTPSSNSTRDNTHGHHQMVNTKIRLIIFFAAEDREVLSSEQKEDRELTVPQIVNSLLQMFNIIRR